MENRKYVKLLIPIFILGFFISYSNVFAYDVETHAFLTSEIVKFYNKNFSNNLISNDLTPYLVDGSRREDDIPRWMNHFYDPVNNRGLTDAILGTWQKSEAWAQDSSNQNQLTYKVPAVIASILTALEQGKISAITAETEFTWQKAISLYVAGQKEQAMFALGHILHLIEDSSVPEHTRNDPHPTGTPLEDYAKQFNLSTPDKNLDTRLTDKNPIVLADLNSYFEGMATYSNNNFYSKDTIGIQSGYNLPQPEGTIKNGGYYYAFTQDDIGTNYLFVYKNYHNSLVLETKDNIALKIQDENKVVNSYWSRLSTKSVEYGAGIINLFIQQAEAAKNNQNTSQNKSFISQTIDAISNFFSGIFGGGDNQNFQPAGQISLDQNSGQTDNTTQTGTQTNTQTQKINQPTNQTIPTTKITKKLKTTTQQTNPDQTQIDNQDENIQDQQVIFEDQPEQNSDTQQTDQFQAAPAPEQCSFLTTQSPSHQGVIINEIAWMGSAGDANNEWIELKNISSGEVNITNWQLLNKVEKIKINFSDLNGSKIIKSGQFILLERTDDNSIPNITADLIYTGAISNSNEGLRLFDNQCNLIDEASANPDWPAGDNTTKKTMERDISGFNWHTSNNVGGTPKAENSISVYSGGGSGSPTSNQSQTTNTQTQQSASTKILINEVQIAPTNSRFIKLYNPNNFSVNLTNWYLQRKTQTATSFSSLASKTYFENKTIAAYGYLLISRDSSSNPDIFLDNLTLTDSNSIQLKNSDGDVIDKVGWGQASDCEGACAISPASDQSIKRKFQNNTYIDTDNNFQDFEIQTNQANQAPGAFFVSNVLISEIMAGTDNSANEEFLELYNPTSSTISLADWSLKRKISQSATSTINLVLAFYSTSTIAAKSFFLITHEDYTNFSTSTVPDLIYTNNSNPLAYTDDVVILYDNNGNVIDQVTYAEIAKNQSLEREAFYNGNCIPAQDSGEFLGNACGNADSFDIRQTPNPQNSLSLPEPRTAPTTPENFTVQYDSSVMKLNFNWQPSQDYNGNTSTLAYKITDTSATSTILTITTSTIFSTAITEIGRDYSFSIQALDEDAFGSEIVTSTISMPSLFSNLYFYNDPRDTDKNLLEAYYNQYPFVPDLFGQNKWRLVVFYLNSDARNDLNNSFWQPSDLTDVLGIKYNICAGGASSKYSLLLPDSQTYCGVDGGAYNAAFNFNQLEDNHFIIQTTSSSQDMNLSENDFITAAFYSVRSMTDGLSPNFQLVAIDKIKYHFSNLPTHQPPQLNGSINLNFDSQSSRLYLDWPKATDPDTLDYLLAYEIKYNDADTWQSLDNSTGTSRLVSPGDNFSISLRVKDDFNDYSTSTLTVSWSYPTTNFYITQDVNDGWGATFGPMNWNAFSPANLQSITPEQNFQFNKVVLKIKRVQDRGDSANLNLSLFTSTSSNSQDQPDFNNLISSADIPSIVGNPENSDLTFSFPTPIPLTSGVKYWFVLEISGFSFNSYDAWVSNAFQNAVSNSDVYLNGDSGQVPLHDYPLSYYLNDQVSINHNQDWYMKIGLGL